MGTKVFLDLHGFRLIGDERDIMVPTIYYNLVRSWCRELEIEAEEVKLQFNPFRQTLWRVYNEQHRALFALRWA